MTNTHTHSTSWWSTYMWFKQFNRSFQHNQPMRSGQDFAFFFFSLFLLMMLCFRCGARTTTHADFTMKPNRFRLKFRTCRVCVCTHTFLHLTLTVGRWCYSAKFRLRKKDKWMACWMVFSMCFSNHRTILLYSSAFTQAMNCPRLFPS